MSPTRQPLRRPKVVSPWASEKPKREALRAEKREAILRAAAICFSQRGIEATTMDDVAGVLGVTKPTVYRLFRDKTALVEACFARACQPSIDAMMAAREAGGSAIEQLRRYMTADLHTMMEDDFGRMLMMPGIVDLYSDASPAYRRGMEQLRRGVDRRGESYVRFLIDDLGGEGWSRPYGGGSFSVARDGTIAYTVNDALAPADVGLLEQGKRRRLAGLNADLLGQRELGQDRGNLEHITGRRPPDPELADPTARA